MNRTALILVTLAALTIFGGIVLGGIVENMANDIVETRTAALAD
jgi:hypothetical protein